MWLDRGKARRIERGFADFEAWRDDVLAQEERDFHKLDRKIEAEEHWMRYGVTARRKRNVRRVAGLQALRQHRRDARRATGMVDMAAAEAERSGALVIEAEGRRQELRPADGGGLFASASSAATASASSAPMAAARPRWSTFSPARSRPTPARVQARRQPGRWRRSTSAAKASTRTGP